MMVRYRLLLIQQSFKLDIIHRLKLLSYVAFVYAIFLF